MGRDYLWNKLGALIYLSTETQPDVAAVVSLLGCYWSDPLPLDRRAMRYLLRYLKKAEEMKKLFLRLTPGD